MKILRWIFAIPLALTIVIGFLWLCVANIDDRLHWFSNPYLYFAAHAFEIIFSFGLFVFLACLFAPKPKKYAALATVVLGATFAGLMLYFQFTQYPSPNLTPTFLITFLGLFIGLSAGVIICYYVFKKKGWEVALIEIEEAPERF